MKDLLDALVSADQQAKIAGEKQKRRHINKY